MIVLPPFFYGMVVIGSLSMEGDGGGCGGARRALGGRWRVVRIGKSQSYGSSGSPSML